jgi:subtilisin-like proprotein convertase family protein
VLRVLIATFAVVAGAIVAAVPALGQPGTAGPVCPAAEPLDLGQGFHDALPGPLAIPDNGPLGAVDCMTIPFAKVQTITDLDVAVTIDHTWVGDLMIELTHIDTGTTVRLLDRPGVPASTLGCNGNDVRATFSDEASALAEEACAGSPAVYDELRPNESLAAFDGELIGGMWQISVSDLAAGDTGVLNSWTLLPAFTPTGNDGDVNCNGSADSIDAALILQIAAGFNFTLQCAEAGDINKNGMLDAIDAALVLQYDAGLVTSWPLPQPLL